MSGKFVAVILAAALLLGGGAALGGYLLGEGIVTARQSDRSVSVKGLAERDVRADLATWSIRFTATGDSLEQVQAGLEGDGEKVRSFLTAAGFGRDEVSSERLEVTDLLAQQYRQREIRQARYIVARTVRVRSANVGLVATAGAQLGELVKQGIVVTDAGGPSYFFTGLNAIKPGMIATATRNARAAAAQFARDSGSRVGGIRHANQGVFRILPRDRSGRSQQQSIDKTVRVVTTVSYALEN